MLLLSSADFFQNKLFQEHYQRNSLCHSVGPDLGPNCLQRLLADDSMVIVKFYDQLVLNVLFPICIVLFLHLSEICPSYYTQNVPFCDKC